MHGIKINSLDFMMNLISPNTFWIKNPIIKFTSKVTWFSLSFDFCGDFSLSWYYSFIVTMSIHIENARQMIKTHQPLNIRIRSSAHSQTDIILKMILVFLFKTRIFLISPSSSVFQYFVNLYEDYKTENIFIYM